MKIRKPKFWNKQSLLSFLLYPLSLIYLLFLGLKKSLSSKSVFRIPIICVGNIYVGGTGKTPLSILITKELLKIKKKQVIIRKFYKSHSDEYKMIRNERIDIITNKNRENAIKEASKNEFDTIILDDGLQDYKISSNCKIICFNQKQKIGNGFTLPAGPLRESLKSIKNSNLILINGDKDIEFEKKLLSYNAKIKIYYSVYKPINIEKFKNKEILALAGIGNPENFFKLLEENKLTISEKNIYPDHYEFSKSELSKIILKAKRNNFCIVTTEKDYFRIKEYNLAEIEYLKTELVIENKKQFLKDIMKIYD